MDWDKAHRLYNKIQDYEYQIGILEKLGKRISEDKRGVELLIKHEDTKLDSKPRHPGFIPFDKFMRGVSQINNDDKYLFEMIVEDEFGLELIGGLISILQDQKGRLKKELEELQS